MIYGTREEQIRAEFTREQVMGRIENVYHAQHDLNNPFFDAWEQLLACEAVAEATPAKEYYYQDNQRTKEENVSVTGMINDTYKRRVNFELTPGKLKLIEELKAFNYRTPPIKIVSVLEEFFKEWPSKSTHWPFIAQAYTPKTINSVLNRLVNLYSLGYLIDNPPGLFTLIIKKRPKRKNKYSHQ